MKISLPALLVCSIQIVAAVRDRELQGVAARCGCNGRLIDRTLDFEVDSSGNPFRIGDTPSDLPFGVKAVGQRRKKGKVGAPTENDLVIFDTQAPTGMDFDLAVEGEMKVIVIHENNDKSDPDDAL